MIENYCNVCVRRTLFIPTHSPKNYWICSQCKCRTSFGRWKLIKGMYGYTFEEDPKWKKKYAKMIEEVNEDTTKEENNETDGEWDF